MPASGHGSSSTAFIHYVARAREEYFTPEIAVRRTDDSCNWDFDFGSIVGICPDRPTLCFEASALVIFVHGCFWHGHGCKKGKASKSNRKFWSSKISGNKKRDCRSEGALRAVWAGAFSPFGNAKR